MVIAVPPSGLINRIGTNQFAGIAKALQGDSIFSYAKVSKFPLRVSSTLSAFSSKCPFYPPWVLRHASSILSPACVTIYMQKVVRFSLNANKPSSKLGNSVNAYLHFLGTQCGALENSPSVDLSPFFPSASLWCFDVKTRLSSTLLYTLVGACCLLLWFLSSDLGQCLLRTL